MSIFLDTLCLQILLKENFIFLISFSSFRHYFFLLLLSNDTEMKFDQQHKSFRKSEKIRESSLPGVVEGKINEGPVDIITYKNLFHAATTQLRIYFKLLIQQSLVSQSPLPPVIWKVPQAFTSKVSIFCQSRVSASWQQSGELTNLQRKVPSLDICNRSIKVD